jgi:hypothetical protein
VSLFLTAILQVHQIIRESGQDISVERGAASIFQPLTESFIIDLLDCTAKMADHAGRVKVTVVRYQFLAWIRGFSMLTVPKEDMRRVMGIVGLGLRRLPKRK